MEWAQSENREVSGTDLIKNRGSVPRISPCHGHSVLIIVQMMDIKMLVQVVGLYTELHKPTCICYNHTTDPQHRVDVSMVNNVLPR